MIRKELGGTVTGRLNLNRTAIFEVHRGISEQEAKRVLDAATQGIAFWSALASRSDNYGKFKEAVARVAFVFPFRVAIETVRSHGYSGLKDFYRYVQQSKSF